MDHEQDLRLIENCVDLLGRHGYNSNVLERVGAHAIGTAAVRLARRDAARASVDLGHPLGFGRVPLTPWALDQPRVAVHVWDGTSAIAVLEDVHDHCYDFVSVCCSGGLEHRVFRLEPRPASPMAAPPLLYSAGSCDVAASEGGGMNSGIAEIGGFTIEAPHIYAIAADTLHTVRPISELTVTIQFQSPIVKPQARVFRLQGQTIGKTSRAPFTPERMTRALTEWR